MSFVFDVFLRIVESMLHFLSLGKRTIKNTLSIYVKTNTGNTLSVDLDPKWDIKNVKEVVAPKLGLTPEEVKIIFAGKELDDSTVVEVCLPCQPKLLRLFSRFKLITFHPKAFLRTLNKTISIFHTIIMF